MNNLAITYSRIFERADKRIFFLVVCGLVFINNYLMNNLVLTDHLYYQSFGEQVAMSRIEQYLAIREKLQYIGYFFIPLAVVIKLLLIAMCLNIGALFADYNISFGKLFKIAILSEVVFILGNAVRLVVLLFFKDVQSLNDIQRFYPLSIMSLANPSDFEKWLHYPLITINFFELFYVLVIAMGISYVTQKSYSSSLKFSLASYGAGLLVWMCFIVFLSINYS